MNKILETVLLLVLVIGIAKPTLADDTIHVDLVKESLVDEHYYSLDDDTASLLCEKHGFSRMIEHERSIFSATKGLWIDKSIANTCFDFSSYDFNGDNKINQDLIFIPGPTVKGSCASIVGGMLGCVLLNSVAPLASQALLGCGSLYGIFGMALLPHSGIKFSKLVCEGDLYQIPNKKLQAKLIAQKVMQSEYRNDAAIQATVKLFGLTGLGHVLAEAESNHGEKRYVFITSQLLAYLKQEATGEIAQDNLFNDLSLVTQGL